MTATETKERGMQTTAQIPTTSLIGYSATGRVIAKAVKTPRGNWFIDRGMTTVGVISERKARDVLAKMGAVRVRPELVGAGE